MQTVANGSGGVLCTNSTAVVHFPNIDRRKIRRQEIPSHCSKGHPLTPGNLRIDRSEQRWRCLQCGRDRAEAFVVDMVAGYRRAEGAANPLVALNVSRPAGLEPRQQLWCNIPGLERQ